MSKIRVSVPREAKQGEIVELKAMIKHEMESGFRRDERGGIIQRDIITLFECLYNGELVFSSEFNPGVSANPFLSFHIRATESGTLTFRWMDQDGVIWSESKTITVI